MREKKHFPIVGIGGSAGGLEAFQGLLDTLSSKPGAALVFIMHLVPSYKSLLPELLSRVTKMPVSEITSGMIPEMDHVYVKPPNANLVFAGGKLVLSPLRSEDARRMPIDSFFQSLADELGNRSIGVILSGTATDGTLGAEAIKAAGGITFAQDEKSAKFHDMPKSAIAAGCVDFVLSPKKISAELERIARHPLIASAAPVGPDRPTIAEGKGFESIFDIVRRAMGLDFTYYKTATTDRRVARRIVLTKQGSLKNYTKLLREDKNEAGLLYEDLLINVTSFFRDPKTFHALERSVLPKILKNKTKKEGVRVWVAGCSSGEEAYSIAMLVTEALGRKAGMIPVSIFATDMSDVAINKARRGMYGPNVKDDVTPGRLKRFFTKEGTSYKIAKSLREMCVFSKQNVFNDPPFSNIDLISCRNLLIYFQPILQRRAFNNFHYSLKSGGFLMLGNSESISGYANLFKDLNRKHKIFEKKYVLRRPEIELGQRYYPAKGSETKKWRDTRAGKEADISGMADHIVLAEYAPCGVLIDSSMQIVQFRGHTGSFLESAAGSPSLDIFKLAREGLLVPLRSAIYKAVKTKKAVKRETDSLLLNGRKVSVMITVVPITSAVLKERFFLVLFNEIGRKAGLKSTLKAPKSISLKRRSSEKDEYIKGIQKELVETKEYLQTVIEEQENANEEVKTANEEILSSNEELQSTNEELETAKEELQSSNEELTTTNEELQNRNADVSLLNNDLVNLLSSINLPVIMMSSDLVIRRVTPQADKVLNVASTDVGRPISKIRLAIDIPDLEKTLYEVMESLTPKTFEIKDREGNWYSASIRPYRTMDNVIDGVVALFIDITERKKASAETERWASFPRLNPRPVFELDMRGMVTFINNATVEWFPDIMKQGYSHPLIRTIVENATLAKRWKRNSISLEFAMGGKWFSVNAYFFGDKGSFIRAYVEDATDRKKMDKVAIEVSSIRAAADAAQARADEIEAAYNELQVTKDALVQAEKLASLGELSAGIAHELNNPLTGILSLGRYHLERMDPNDSKYGDLKEIVSAGERMEKIIKSLVDYARPSNEETEKLDCNDIIEAVLEFRQKIAPDNDVDIHKKYELDAPMIVGDKNQLHQVVTNIISNAIDAMQKKGQLTISTRIVTIRGKRFVEMAFEDSGPGISKENLKKLFSPFFTTKRPDKGVGLGLSIAYSIIKRHKGEITVESPPAGRKTGAAFKVRIPAIGEVSEALKK